jgi:uncharacterized RDD family membrane protein YckC
VLIALALGAWGLVLAGGSAFFDVAFIFFLTTANLVFWGYYILFETMWEGQSPGKRALGVRVLKTSGMPIGFLDAVIRNLVRIVDFLPFFYGVGVVTMFISPQSRRLGDLAAGTLVVRERVAITLDSLQAATAEAGRTHPVPGEDSWNIGALTPDHQAGIRAFLDRAPYIRPEHMREHLAGDLAQGTAAGIGASVTGPPEEFLRRVLALSSGHHLTHAAGSRPRNPEELAWDLRVLTPQDDQLVDEFLGRSPDLKPEPRRHLGAQLANRIAAQIGASEPANAEAFLQRVMVLRRTEADERG